MRVLVAFATRHEATAEIAERVGDVLRNAVTAADPAAVVDVRNVHTVGDVEDYDAVVVGSAVYLGRWLEAAWRFLHDNRQALLARPVWLFASGPVGDPLLPRDEPSEVDHLVGLVGARTHQVFAGALRPAALGGTERMLIHQAHSAEGDFRDWPLISRWSTAVADDLLEMLAEAG